MASENSSQDRRLGELDRDRQRRTSHGENRAGVTLSATTLSAPAVTGSTGAEAGPCPEGEPGSAVGPAVGDLDRPDLDPATRALVVAAAGFVTALRQAGLTVPLSSAVTYVRALCAVGGLARATRYWCGLATLVVRREDFATYRRVFMTYWAGVVDDEATELARLSRVILVTDQDDGAEGDESGSPNRQKPDFVMRYSAAEVLRDKDFAKYDAVEKAQLSYLISKMRLGSPTRRSRRMLKSAGRSAHPDLRRTVRGAIQTDGEPFRRAFRERGLRHRRIVLLVDVSGSMEAYARPLLRFVHATMLARRDVEVFALGTRLTRLTRHMITHDPDRALDDAAAAVSDWSGGTRLGASLKAFNDQWAIRGLARGAVAVIMSDGWDRGEPAVMSEQMERLSRVTFKILWSNPLKFTDGYQPLAQGMAAALPHVDEFIEGHSLSALERLADLIDACSLQQRSSRRQARIGQPA